MKHVIVIEDDEDIVDLLANHLTDLDCGIDKAYDGPAGLSLALEKPYDLIITDIMLPGMDGLDVCRKLRAHSVSIPILVLTAKSEKIDKILGLETGSDDYLTKPFSVRKFISQVKTLFRRVQMIRESLPSKKGIIRHADLLIDQENYKVVVGEKRVRLTPK